MGERVPDQSWCVSAMRERLPRNWYLCHFQWEDGLPFPNNRALLYPLVLALLAFAGLPSSGSALAQSASSYSASNMWGTTPSGVAVPGAVDSSIAHGQNSAVAAAVNAAQQGTLLGTGIGGGSIYSIGSQTIVSNTVVGNNNSADIHASQSAQNSGDISNSGQLAKDINN